MSGGHDGSQRQDTAEPASGTVMGALAGAAPSSLTQEPHAALALETDPRERRASRAEARLAPGTRVGRYRIVDRLGAGGVGNVYRAYDPDLSRNVALEVLHGVDESDEAGGEHQRRLLQEWRALATLSHPNIVTVYDVAMHAGAVFVAMELVQGESLHAWLQTPRRRDDVLRVLCAAGRGLCAAHAAGVTHGDLEPANVMVSEDGRVRIVDFGFARWSPVARADAPASVPAVQGPRTRFDATPIGAELTHTWRLRGTPGYLAPELLGGEPSVDTQADQFAFAVTLFVALTGRRPFPGNTLAEYELALASGTRAAWPPGVPWRVRSIVERGLSLRPADRFPELGALVEALERSAAPRRRRRGWLVLAFGGALVVSGMAVLRGRASRATCQVDSASFAGVWDGTRRAELQRSLVSTGRPNAGDAFAQLAARLDTFERSFRAMKQEACEASLVREEQSEQVLALRYACLARKRESVGALVSAFSEPDVRAVDRAAGAMPDSIQDCADVPALLGKAAALPASLAARAAIQEVESALAVVAATIAAGRDGRALASQQLDAARALGHEGTTALALSWMARANESAVVGADREKGRALLLECKQMLHESLHLAAAGGDPLLLARTASYLFNILAFREKRAEEADAVYPVVDALVTLTGDDPEARLEVLVSQGVILSQRGKYEEALDVFAEAVATSARVESYRRSYGALAQGQMGEIYYQLRRYPEALRARQMEVEGVRSTFGARHPRVIMSLFHLGLAQAKTGQVDEAWKTAADLRELLESVTPPGDWRMATSLFLEGNIWEKVGDCPRALPLYRDALERVESFNGPSHSNSVDVHERLGQCLQLVGRASEGIAELERALSIRRELGAAPNKIAELAFQLADALWRHGAAPERQRALELGQESRALWLRDGVEDQARAAQAWVAERQAP